MLSSLRLTAKPNILGAAASTLCLIHCLATPFLFVAQAEIAGHAEAHPEWWGTLDILFLIISLAAVWRSAQTSSKTWMQVALWGSWIVLAFILLNEKMGWYHLMEEVIYLPTLALIFFHLYNRKYCQCGEADCCATEQIES
ncbi:MerC domain-containing protein [Flagellimonas sp. DF-77]|uniref:MerC domain-containing protein n=1 Tax=Flagellimonas algarum TaxID=3230298 RepID=UPI0033996FFF